MTNNVSFSINENELKKLEELRKGIAVNRSEFVRKMINYFYENKELLEEI